MIFISYSGSIVVCKSKSRGSNSTCRELHHWRSNSRTMEAGLEETTINRRRWTGDPVTINKIWGGFDVKSRHPYVCVMCVCVHRELFKCIYQQK